MFALALACAVAFAPAPLQKRDKSAPQHVTAGHYRMTWGAGKWDVTLRGDGYYLACGGNSVWHGGWTYDRATRTLSVRESCGAGEALCWSVPLDLLLCGTAKDLGGVAVALARR